MKKFIIGKDNFGVGEITYNIDRENLIIKDLTIIGNEQISQKLSEKGKWDWILYPPKIYFKEIPFQIKENKIESKITEEILDNYDVALYLMEHNDIIGKFTIENDVFFFKGFVYIEDRKKQLELEVNLNNVFE